MGEVKRRSTGNLSGACRRLRAHFPLFDRLTEPAQSRHRLDGAIGEWIGAAGECGGAVSRL